MPSHFYCLVASLWLLATVASAQIAPTSPARQRADNRRAVREASRTDVPYQASHFDITHQQLPRGGSPPNLPVANEPRFNRRGQPRKAKAGFRNWRRPKNEPKP